MRKSVADKIRSHLAAAERGPGGAEPPIPDFARSPDVKGRHMFLVALRALVPQFWKGLNDAWRAAAPDALLAWFERWNVRDAWLLAVVRDTLDYWTADPGSPDAQLQPDHKWFLHRSYYELKVKPFEFVLRDGAPRFRDGFDPRLCQVIRLGDTETVWTERLNSALREAASEPIEEFEKRTRKDFEEQLRQYGDRYRRQQTFSRDPEIVRHSAWTAVRFAGLSYHDITARAPEFRRSTYYGDGHRTVYMGITRFADQIGLTLPKAR